RARRRRHFARRLGPTRDRSAGRGTRAASLALQRGLSWPTGLASPGLNRLAHAQHALRARVSRVKEDDMAEYDLVVIGTGTAGATVAHRVRSKGWRVAIVDKRPF